MTRTHTSHTGPYIYELLADVKIDEQSVNNMQKVLTHCVDMLFAEQTAAQLDNGTSSAGVCVCMCVYMYM